MKQILDMNLHKIQNLLLLLLVGTIISCGANPYAATNRYYKKKAKEYSKDLLKHSSEDPQSTLQKKWVGTTNFNLRKPNYVIIHHTAQDSVEQTLHTFTLKRTQVSAHYVIAKDGTTYQMLNDFFRAWHAGVGEWGSNKDINSSSIGIELDNNGKKPFPEEQINSLLQLLNELKGKYNIPIENFLGHADIAPTRKSDPNIFFPWERLAHNGFGVWYDRASIKNKDIQYLLTAYPPLPFQDTIFYKANIPDFNTEEALKIIGYDISDLPAAIRAFKLHFIGNNIDKPLSEFDKAILYEVYQNFLYL